MKFDGLVEDWSPYKNYGFKNARKLEQLIDSRLPVGRHEVRWNASKHSSGIYFYRLSVQDHISVKKMIYLK